MCLVCSPSQRGSPSPRAGDPPHPGPAAASGAFLTQPDDGPAAGEGEGEAEGEGEGVASEEDDLARLERIDERLRELRASRPADAGADGSVGRAGPGAAAGEAEAEESAGAYSYSEDFTQPSGAAGGEDPLSATITEDLSEIVSEVASEGTLTGNYTSDFSVLSATSHRDYDEVMDVLKS